jgi:hypothetical protein
VLLENACISKLIKTGSCLGDDPPPWVLKRVKTYLKHDMVSSSFLHITMNSIEDEYFSIWDLN